MNPRQQYALTHPLDTASADPTVLAPYAQDRRHRTGLILRTILAVDR